jgi:hypothetical protein
MCEPCRRPRRAPVRSGFVSHEGLRVARTVFVEPPYAAVARRGARERVDHSVPGPVERRAPRHLDGVVPACTHARGRVSRLGHRPPSGQVGDRREAAAERGPGRGCRRLARRRPPRGQQRHDGERGRTDEPEARWSSRGFNCARSSPPLQNLALDGLLKKTSLAPPGRTGQLYRTDMTSTVGLTMPGEPPSWRR